SYERAWPSQLEHGLLTVLPARTEGLPEGGGDLRSSPWPGQETGPQRGLRSLGCVGGHSLPTEKVRSIRLVLPWRSFTETVSVPLGSVPSGLSRVSSQTPADFGLNLAATFSPAAVPFTGKSATIWKDVMSRPVS